MTRPPRPPIATVRPRTTLPSRIVTLVAVVVPPLGVLSARPAVGRGVPSVDLALAACCTWSAGLGITVGYHRLFSHKAFETTPAVRAVLAVLGSMTVQGPVTQWVTDHRKHHALSDQEGDPHSPHAASRDAGGRWRASSTPTWAGCSTKGMERGAATGGTSTTTRWSAASTASTCCGWC